MILDPGLNLTLRPMKYPQFYEMYRAGVKNTWTVEEVNLSGDIADLMKMSKAERHLIRRLVAFFATGDTIVANNVILSLYRHINSPEARMYLSRQLYEEALHIQFYLTLLDTYLPDTKEREDAFKAIDTIPSIKAKGAFCQKYLDSVLMLDTLDSKGKKKEFLLNLICFAACIEGLFFFAAFAYVYFFRSKGLLHGLASGTNWVFRDESCHMNFAFAVIRQIRKEDPDLFDGDMRWRVRDMIQESVGLETAFAEDVLEGGIAGLNLRQMNQYLRYCADRRFESLDMEPIFNDRNPFDFMDLQDVQELTNFFERRVSAYQVDIPGTVQFDEAF